ncbi:MAG: HigA family addiction module antitoxin [Truepera sp.]|jgi:addiction module HigA family antidote|nr:HigA family addiction module antitoxin [Truepera sp.]
MSDLTSPPGNRLEALKGKREGRHSIRVNDQFRIVFRWDGGNAYEVEVVGYHFIRRGGAMTDMMTTMRVAPYERDLAPIHPGEVLKEEFLEPYGLSQYELARRTGMPAQRIGQIVHGKRSITADTAWRLAMFFDNSPRFWLNLQAHYDLEVAAQEHGEELVKAVPSTVKDIRPGKVPTSG